VLLAAPGDENILVEAATALLVMCRPLFWRHAYLPLVSDTIIPVVQYLITQEKPFLVGMYHRRFRAIIQSQIGTNKPSGDSSDFILPDDEWESLLADVPRTSYLTRVTVVDLDSGSVFPGCRMKFAGRCVVSNLIDPEFFPVAHDSFDSKETLPPIPARYRSPLMQKRGGLHMLLSDQKIHTSNGSVGNLSNHDKPSSGSGSGALSRLKIPRGTRSTPFSTVSFPVERPDPIGDRDTARKVGENMIVFMRDFFVSLLKTVPLFLVEL